MKFPDFLKVLLIAILLVFSASAQNKKPKNIIILIGDGMGLNYVSASVLSLENSPYHKFPITGLSVTASADKLITDSAAGATAIATGYRNNYYSVSVDTSGKPLYTLFEHAESLGLSTGVVVTSTVTHATPGAFLSHVINRKDEDEIARQFLEIDVDVVIGGGSKYFKSLSEGGVQKKNLLKELESKGYNFYQSFDVLMNSYLKNKFYALLDSTGLPPASYRNYTLGELTSAALFNLSQKEKGFILMVEGSQIDWGGHDNITSYAISELNDFNTAINTALDFAEKDGNTLVIVTADHETGGMSITGGELNGDNLSLSYTTGGHTAEMVGVFAKGPGQELFSGLYDNFQIGRKLFFLIDEDYKFLKTEVK